MQETRQDYALLLSKVNSSEGRVTIRIDPAALYGEMGNANGAHFAFVAPLPEPDMPEAKRAFGQAKRASSSQSNPS